MYKHMNNPFFGGAPVGVVSCGPSRDELCDDDDDCDDEDEDDEDYN